MPNQIITRAYQVICDNPMGGTAAINYRRHDVLDLADGQRVVVKTYPDVLVAVLTEETAEQTFPLLNDHGEPTGATMSNRALYEAMASHFAATLAAKNEADAQAAAAAQSAQAGGGDA